MGPHDHFQEAQRDFYLAYGLAMSGWAEIEYRFGDLFIAMTGMPKKVGRDVFQAAHSFTGRVDLFNAAVPHARTIPAGRDFLSKAAGLARQWAPVRNILAHEAHTLIVKAASDLPFAAIQPHRGAILGVEQINTAAVNFFRFEQMLRVSRGAKQLLREPELCCELLAQQPKDALQDVSEPMSLVRLQAQIAASLD